AGQGHRPVLEGLLHVDPRGGHGRELLRAREQSDVEDLLATAERRMTMKNIVIQLAAVGLLGLVALAPSAALAGKGGSAAAIEAAVSSHSTDAIIAEVERAESLICERCIGTLTQLTEDSRFEVREVAAWWFARRPALKEML